LSISAAIHALELVDKQRLVPGRTQAIAAQNVVLERRDQPHVSVRPERARGQAAPLRRQDLGMVDGAGLPVGDEDRGAAGQDVLQPVRVRPEGRGEGPGYPA
jgi:hypothetical protein